MTNEDLLKEINVGIGERFTIQFDGDAHLEEKNAYFEIDEFGVLGLRDHEDCPIDFYIIELLTGKAKIIKKDIKKEIDTFEDAYMYTHEILPGTAVLPRGYYSKLKKALDICIEKEVRHIREKQNGIFIGDCPSCGHSVMKLDKNCSNCGQKLNWMGRK